MKLSISTTITEMKKKVINSSSRKEKIAQLIDTIPMMNSIVQLQVLK